MSGMLSVPGLSPIPYSPCNSCWISGEARRLSSTQQHYGQRPPCSWHKRKGGTAWSRLLSPVNEFSVIFLHTLWSRNFQKCWLQQSSLISSLQNIFYQQKNKYTNKNYLTSGKDILFQISGAPCYYGEYQHLLTETRENIPCFPQSYS